MVTAVPRARSRWTRVILGLVLGLSTRPAAATSVRIVTPESGKPLVAGQLVELRWDQLPEDVDEMELLLDMNAGGAQRLRLTPQLGGATRSYLWKVPNLVAHGARLRLRWGLDGVEVEGEASAPFTIVPDMRTPLDGVRFRRGEFWVGDRLSISDPSGDGHGRLIEAGRGCSLAGALSSASELSPDENGNRRHLLPDHGRRIGCAGPDNRETADHRPLTIPLRT